MACLDLTGVSLRLTASLLLVPCACGPDSAAGGSSGSADAGADSTTQGSEDDEAGSAPTSGTGASTGSDPGEGTNATVTSTGATGIAPGCENPELIVLEGVDTGFVRCADGGIQRPTPGVCVATTSGSCNGTEDERACETDADCTDGPNGVCVGGCADPECIFTSCGCHYECETDSDCDAGTICRCRGVGPDASRNACIPATCVDDSECETRACGLSVLWWNDNDTWATQRMACRTDADTCRGDGECGEWETCSLCPDDTAWDCEQDGYFCESS